MTPATAIAALDRQIANRGQTVMLRKASAANGAGDVSVRAFVRGYQPEELSGGIQQGDSTMIVSPTALAASGFVGALKRLDRVTVAGKMQIIQVANPVMMDDTIVRWEFWLRGA
jgi:hypothetical protein